MYRDADINLLNSGCGLKSPSSSPIQKPNPALGWITDPTVWCEWPTETQQTTRECRIEREQNRDNAAREPENITENRRTTHEAREPHTKPENYTRNQRTTRGTTDGARNPHTEPENRTRSQRTTHGAREPDKEPDDHTRSQRTTHGATEPHTGPENHTRSQKTTRMTSSGRALTTKNGLALYINTLEMHHK